MINVNFVREVDLYSGAFPANRGNALSSVMEFKQIDGNPDRIASSLTVGSSDFEQHLMVQSIINCLVFSRRSYLQLLFSAIGLPFYLPTMIFSLKQKLN